jgi:hypothetical protein
VRLDCCTVMQLLSFNYYTERIGQVAILIRKLHAFLEAAMKSWISNLNVILES